MINVNDDQVVIADQDARRHLSPPEFVRRVPRNLDDPLPMAETSPGASAPDTSPMDVMAELERLISTPPKTPRIGLDASALMARCFETLAEDVERIAKERVDAALEIQQEAHTYAVVLRDSGKLLSGKIESEAARLFQASQAIRRTREMLRIGLPDPSQG